MAKSTFSAIVLFTLILLSCNNRSKKEQEQSHSEEIQLKNLISQYPDSFALKEKLINYYQINNNSTVAIEETKKLIAKDSGDYRLWNIQANLFLDKNDTSGAIASLQKVIALKPDPDNIKDLAYLYAKKGDAAALELADALLSAPLANAQQQAIFIKGIYYSATGDKQKAIAAFDQCIAMNYNDMFSYREKAISLYDLGKYNDALAVLQKAITVKSSFDEAYYWMGRCYEKLGKKDDAIQNYQSALQLDSSYGEAEDALKRLGVKQ